MAARTGPEATTIAFNDLAEALGRYLEAIGWRAVVVSSPRVQKWPGEREFIYEFVVGFTGGKVRSDDTDTHGREGEASTGGGREGAARAVDDVPTHTLKQISATKAQFAQLVGDLHTEHNQNTNAIGELAGKVADLDRHVKQLEKDVVPS